MNKPPAYQHYARDWLVDTASLSLEEQGAYLRLLDYEWIDGPLVDDHIELARRLAVTRKVFSRIWPRLARFFKRGDDGLLRNERLEHQREAQRLYRERQSERGRQGAAKRWPISGHAEGHGAGHGTRDAVDDDRTGGGALALPSASAPAPADTQLHDSASRRAETKPDSRDGEPTFPELMSLVRTHLYPPDGKPAADWDEKRDGSILKALLKRHRAGEVAIAIEGLAVARDFPGVYADAVDWLKPLEKVTLRALFNSRSGVLPMFSIATQAYWKRENSRAKTTKAGHVERIGEVLKRAIEGP